MNISCTSHGVGLPIAPFRGMRITKELNTFERTCNCILFIRYDISLIYILNVHVVLEEKEIV